MSWPFRMITLKQILSQIYPGDWFFSLDLKDAYFYIQIAPYHRPFSTQSEVELIQGQLFQEHTVSQTTDIVPGNSFHLSPNESCGHAKACSGHTAARGLLRDRSLSHSQTVSVNAGPHGLHIPCATIGPASYAVPSALAESEGYIWRMTPANQGEPGMRDSPRPLEMSSVDGTGHTLDNGLQKVVSTVSTDASNTGWGGLCEG